MRNPGEVGLLGKVLANQSVSVLVQATFPTGIWMSEVNTSLQGCGDGFVFAELFAVVDRDGVDLFRAR